MKIIQNIKNYFLHETDFRKPKTFFKSVILYIPACIVNAIIFITTFPLKISGVYLDLVFTIGLVAFAIAWSGLLPFLLSFITLKIIGNVKNTTAYCVSIIFGFIFSFILSLRDQSPEKLQTFALNTKTVSYGILFAIISCAFILYGLNERFKKEKIK